MNLRERYWRLYAALHKAVGGEGAAWYVITWLGHGLFAFAAGLAHERLGYAVAAWYTLREGEQVLGGGAAPWYDQVADVAFPWLGYVAARWIRG